MCFIELLASDLCDTDDGSGMITVRGPEGGDLPPSTPPPDCGAIISHPILEVVWMRPASLREGTLDGNHITTYLNTSCLKDT